MPAWLPGLNVWEADVIAGAVAELLGEGEDISAGEEPEAVLGDILVGPDVELLAIGLVEGLAVEIAVGRVYIYMLKGELSAVKRTLAMDAVGCECATAGG